MCICMHLCQTHSFQSLCVFPCFEELAGDIIWVRQCLKNTKSPIQRTQQPYPTPTQSRGHQTHPAHSLESLWKAMCTCTAVKHSQENIRQRRKVKKKREQEDGTKTWRPPPLSRNCLPPAFSSTRIYVHQT